MTVINEWRIFCETEGIWTYGHLAADSGIPTTCFTDTAHTVNTNSIQIVDTVDNSAIRAKIVEETIETGGYFRCEGHKFTIAAGTTDSHMISWPYPISVLESYFTCGTNQEGDVINVVTGPDTIVGTITANVAISDTVIPVSLTVVQNAQVGWDFKIGSDNLGYIIGIDANALTITLATPVTSTYTSGDYAKIEVPGIRDLEIGPAAFRYQIGASKTGGKYLPANTNVKVSYTNNGVNPITFRYQLEYLY